MKQDVNGAAAVHEHPLESNVVDARVQDQRKSSWFWDGSPLILSAEGDLLVRPGGNLESVIELSELSTFRQALLRSFLSHFDSIETFPPKME